MNPTDDRQPERPDPDLPEEESAADHSLDRLLSEAVHELEPAPRGLHERLAHQLRAAPRRRSIHRKAATVLVVAASIALLVGSWMLWRGEARQVSENSAVTNDAEDSSGSTTVESDSHKTPDPKSLVRVRPTDPTQAVYVPMPTHSPNVTIVWTYPTINAAERSNNADSAL